MSENISIDSRLFHDDRPREQSEMTSESEFEDHKKAIELNFKTEGKPNYILEYIHKIETGEIVASKRLTKVYQRLRANILEPEGQYVFDIDKGLRVIEFIETFCKHSKGKFAGEPFLLLLFQKAFILALFGFVDKKTGYRQFQEAFFLIARKGGKSTLASAIALYMLMADGEAGSQCFSVATKKDQAKIIFEEAYNMVKQNPALSKYIRKRKSDLYFEPNFSVFEPLSSDSNSLDGKNSYMVSIDECHAIKDRNLYEVMKQSISARTQPIILITTTAGTVRENIFDDLYNYASKVADGEIKDDRFLPIFYELDNKNEYLEEKNWEKANPALGSIKKWDYLRGVVERAKHNEKDLKGVLCKDFNVISTSSDSWLDYESIVNEATFDLNDFNKDFYAIGGVDLSLKKDLTVATVLLATREPDMRYVEQMAFLPKEGFEERCLKENDIPYETWLKHGWLTLTEGTIVDYSEVTKWFNHIRDTYSIDIYRVHFDRWNSGYWEKEMIENGYNMIGTPQGAKTQSIPLQLLEADLKSKKLNYNNNPILRWCLFNTGVVTDTNENIKPVKKGGKDSRFKKDATDSLLNAYVGLYENYQKFMDAQPR